MSRGWKQVWEPTSWCKGDNKFLFDPKKTNLDIACCDCGSVHNIDFKIVGDKVQVTIKKRYRETFKFRKKYPKELEFTK